MWLLQGILWSKYKKLFLEKKIASFWVTNVTAKIKLLHGLLRQLALTEMNKLLDSVALVSLYRS